jgi:hypothetical protein
MTFFMAHIAAARRASNRLRGQRCKKAKLLIAISVR